MFFVWLLVLCILICPLLVLDIAREALIIIAIFFPIVYFLSKSAKEKQREEKSVLQDEVLKKDEEKRKTEEDKNKYITARSRAGQRKQAFLWDIQDRLENEYDIYWNITGDSYKCSIGQPANIRVDEEILEYIDVDEENGCTFNKNNLFDEYIVPKEDIEKIILSIEPEKYQYIITPAEILIQREVDNPQKAVFSI